MNRPIKRPTFDTMELYKIQYSIEDSIRIFDESPVKRNIVADVNKVQLGNRGSMAHLAIEKGLKSLISGYGGPLQNIHDLNVLYNDLTNSNKDLGEFLAIAFDDAVKSFRYNVKDNKLKHLGSIGDYLSKAGTKFVFMELRYWSLGESGTGIDPFQYVQLPIHREILYSIWCFLADDDPNPETVSSRVERTVRQAMFNNRTWSSGETQKEKSIRWYKSWLFDKHKSCRDALKEAVEKSFHIYKDEFINQTVRNAFVELKQSKDDAIRYFAISLTYLPEGSQKRNPDAVPCVEWHNKDQTRGSVKTPGQTYLGVVEKYVDRSWGITPSEEGLVMVKAIAISLKDAKNFLVNRLTERIVFEVNGEERHLRIVKKRIYERNAGAIYNSGEMELSPETIHDLELWDIHHGIIPGDRVFVQLPFEGEERKIRYKLEGKVEDVSGVKVSIYGMGVHGFLRDKDDTPTEESQ